MTEQVEVKENLLNNDHETPDRTKASTSIPRYQNNSDSQTSTMFLRPSLLPSSSSSSSSFGFEIGQRKPDTPRPTSKAFCLNPSRLSLNTSISTSKSSNSSDQIETEVEETQPKELPISSPPPVFGTVITKSRTQKPDEVSLIAGFIFGQNLHERVELNKEADSISEDNKKPNDTQEAEVSSSSNVISSFGNLKNEESDENGKLDETAEESKRRLMEAAKEYEESRASKRKYEEVDCMTGEENDINVFQLNTCKLYMYDNAKSNWVEKGRGQLRVNDMDGGQSSRVVMRNNGNLKVILNTKIWADMKVEKVSEKSVRLTAFEEDSIKVFLVLGPAKNIEEFVHVLDTRVERHKEADRKKKPAVNNDKEEEFEGTLV